VFRYSKTVGEEYYMIKLNKEGLELMKVTNGAMEQLVYIEEPFDVVETVNTYDLRVK
jgi:hypothetical protein